jgi:NAD(P)-dependent dehydrogenase (short-subunit alcohol dehydrogenase family)
VFRLDAKVVAVIGAGSGIGAAVAMGCGRLGARVAVIDINEAAARAIDRRLKDEGCASDAIALDIRDGPAVDRTLTAFSQRYGRLDAVISTPGVNVRKTLVTYSDEEFDRVVTLNLKGAFNVLRAAGRLMLPQKSGSIVLFSSIRAHVVEPGQGVYAATKAGIAQLAKTGAAELGSAGVRVNAIAPGVVETPLTEPIQADPAWYDAYANKSALRRWATAEEMVGPVIFLVSDASSYVTGTTLVADGGWLAVDGRFTPPGM